jgi:hypothetical protein
MSSMRRGTRSRRPNPLRCVTELYPEIEPYDRGMLDVGEEHGSLALGVPPRLVPHPEMAWLSPPHGQTADTSRNLCQIIVELVIPAGQPMNDRAGYRSRIEIEMR